ncbi:MAG: magnesium/cobalt transporter CorA [Pseudomonadota bacterium]|nr:magnesium/cobalt transporter CorA [Pseudomonadota bacterium]
MAYFAKRYHSPGTAPGTLVEHREAQPLPLRISVIDYTAASYEERADIEPPECRPYLERPTTTWIHVQGHPDPQTLEKLAGYFSLHPLALEDVINYGQRPKVELYDEQYFVTLSLPVLDEDRAQAEQVSLFMGEHYLVSFHAGRQDPFEPVRKRLRRPGSRIRQRNADYLLYALIDRVIDQGFPVLEQFGEAIEALETELLDQPDQDTLGCIHQLRRDLLLQRRLLWPEREVINQLLRDEHGLVRDETKLYLRDCYDHSMQIMDLLETYREMTTGMLDVYLSSTSHRLNEIMRVLTMISTVFIPLTFIVGVYGMNFGRESPSPWAMPELDWPYSYPLVWLAMVAIAVGMLVFFRRRRWL